MATGQRGVTDADPCSTFVPSPGLMVLLTVREAKGILKVGATFTSVFPQSARKVPLSVCNCCLFGALAKPADVGTLTL